MVQHSEDPLKPSLPCDVFDLICGTATGGLIAILIGRLGMTCDDAISAYDSMESAIFNKYSNIEAILNQTQGLKTDGLQKVLEGYIKDCTGNPDTLMLAAGRQKCKTLVTVVSTSTANDSDPIRLRSYTAPRRQDGTVEADPTPGETWSIQRAALATALCPVVFQLGMDEFFMAANASGFSNPSMIAYLEALSLFGQDAELTLISLGMGLRNRHDYGFVPKDGIAGMIQQLGILDIANNGERMKTLISQTQCVATSTQVKHQRLQVLTDRNPNHMCIRLDPYRGGNLFIFVDYVQKKTIQHIVDDFFKGFPERFDLAVDYIRRTDSKWIELPHRTMNPTVDDPLSYTTKTSLGKIKCACLPWERTTGRYVTGFAVKTAKGSDTKEVQRFTGDIVPVYDKDSTLFVRVLLDDQWRFYQRRMADGVDWEGSIGPAQDPIPAIQTARGLPRAEDINAFTSDGMYTRSPVTPDQVNVHEFSFQYPYHGTWVRVVGRS